MPEPTELSGKLQLTILGKIGGGGMGTVYLAVQRGVESFYKTVAVKMILDRFSRDHEFVRMFIGEAKLVADLVHQNIVQVYHLGRASGMLYIVMEYVEGANLTQFIGRHRQTGTRIPIELAAYVASRICRGLEYAHKKSDAEGHPLGVVHRDISPTNVMLTHLGEIKILDFGIAKARNLMIDHEGEMLLGKLRYMAPEQLLHRRSDHRSDLYSLGLVLWEMLSGQKPPSGTREENRLRPASIPTIADLVPEVPDRLREILDTALAPEPQARYQDAGQLGYDLEYFIYHKGYGPTIVTLETYLQGLFPVLDGPGVAEETTAEPLPNPFRARPRHSGQSPDSQDSKD